MPSKIQLDENLWFLYICLQKSDLKTIDFAAVGASTNLKAPAARMRYTRLRRQIESGTLIGTHGTPFTASSDKKRKREQFPAQMQESKKSDQDIEDEVTPNETPLKQGKKKNDSRQREESLERAREEANEVVVKKERVERWGFDSDEASDEDSEEEVPLAKLRRAKMASLAVSGSLSSTPTVGDQMSVTARDRNYGQALAHQIPSSVGFGWGRSEDDRWRESYGH